MKTVEYLAAVKAKLEITSDYKLAKALGIPSNLVAKYQSGKNVPGPLTCFKIAEILGDQPAAVIAELELERAEKMAKNDDATAWKGLIQKIGGGAMSVLFMLGGGGISNADAKLATDRSQINAVNGGYIVSRKQKKKVWRNRWFTGLLPLPMAC